MASRFRKTRKSATKARKKVEPLPLSAPPKFVRPEGVACPDFLELGPAKGFPPDVLDPGGEPLDRLILALALACNDLRDCNWVMEQLDRGKPSTFRYNAYEGNWMGARLWISRVALAVCHEALSAINKHQTVLAASEEVRSSLEQLSSVGRTNWEWLFALALNTKDTDQKFLAQIRNSIAYHYYDPKRLGEGYRDFFNSDDRTPHNEYARVSVGRRIKNIRFYFADAAAQGAATAASEAVFGSGDDAGNRGTAAVNRITVTLNTFVLGFLQCRVRARQMHSR